jgi:hypothetical protein
VPGDAAAPGTAPEKEEEMELEVTWNRAVLVWWAYLWRSVVAIVVGMLVAVIVGAVGGAVLGILGVSARTIQQIMLPVGIAIGLLASIVPIKMILGKDFGEFRVVLVAGRDWRPAQDILGRRVQDKQTGSLL